MTSLPIHLPSGVWLSDFSGGKSWTISHHICQTGPSCYWALHDCSGVNGRTRVSNSEEQKWSNQAETV